jgi:hypothetical protein
MPTEKEAGWAPEVRWIFLKKSLSPLPGIEPSIFQPVASSLYQLSYSDIQKYLHSHFYIHVARDDFISVPPTTLTTQLFALYWTPCP